MNWLESRCDILCWRSNLSSVFVTSSLVKPCETLLLFVGQLFRSLRWWKPVQDAKESRSPVDDLLSHVPGMAVGPVGVGISTHKWGRNLTVLTLHHSEHWNLGCWGQKLEVFAARAICSIGELANWLWPSFWYLKADPNFKPLWWVFLATWLCLVHIFFCINNHLHGSKTDLGTVNFPKRWKCWSIKRLKFFFLLMSTYCVTEMCFLFTTQNKWVEAETTSGYVFLSWNFFSFKQPHNLGFDSTWVSYYLGLFSYFVLKRSRVSQTAERL